MIILDSRLQLLKKSHHSAFKSNVRDMSFAAVFVILHKIFTAFYFFGIMYIINYYYNFHVHSLDQEANLV